MNKIAIDTVKGSFLHFLIQLSTFFFVSSGMIYLIEIFGDDMSYFQKLFGVLVVSLLLGNIQLNLTLGGKKIKIISAYHILLKIIGLTVNVKIDSTEPKFKLGKVMVRLVTVVYCALVFSIILPFSIYTTIYVYLTLATLCTFNNIVRMIFVQRISK